MTKQERIERIKKNEKCNGQIIRLLDSVGVSLYKKTSIFNRFRWCIVVILFGFTIMGIIGFIVHHRHNFKVMLSGVSIGLSLLCVLLKVIKKGNK